MNNIITILRKQTKDTLKNRVVFLQFFMCPALALVMEKFMQAEGTPPLFYLRMMSGMYITFAPITAMASIMSEEKEKNTLRVLIMSNVKAWQYILGTGIYVLGMCLIGTTVMALATGMPKGDLPVYYGFMTFGFIVSILIGAAIGMYGKNQMAAQSVATSVMLVIGFMPTLATFNETIQKIARFLYNQQIINIFSDMSINNLGTKSVIILIASVIFAVAVFYGAFKKKGLE